MVVCHSKSVYTIKWERVVLQMKTWTVSQKVYHVSLQEIVLCMFTSAWRPQRILHSVRWLGLHLSGIIIALDMIGQTHISCTVSSSGTVACLRVPLLHHSSPLHYTYPLHISNQLSHPTTIIRLLTVLCVSIMKNLIVWSLPSFYLIFNTDAIPRKEMLYTHDM